MSRVVVTKEGLAKIKAELETLVRVERPAISAALAHARSLGDLSENAEYHSAKDKQGLIESRIRKLQVDLAQAEVIEESQLAQGVAVFGRSVKVKDLSDNSHEADFDSGKISVESPIGKGLLGKKKGDTAEITVPSGSIKYKIISIT
jgi:transcription elongation factor GreA